ncbi:MAG TPA: phosphatase PAP2 family protein [Polyangia bacterium]|nr:phosphatase PAP2 family protein [Polyangia bacterium]
MNARRAAVALALIVAALWSSRSARATEAPSETARRGWSPRLEPFRPWEYVATAGVQATSLYVRWNLPPPTHARWTGDNPFDDAVRAWLRADTAEGRARADHLSDWVSYAGTAAPFAIDLPVVLFAHRDGNVTWQMLMMDLEATAAANFANNVLFYAAGRGRPSSKDCAADPSYDRLCGGASNNASLPSGHTVTIATAAGLTCVHHRHLRIYENELADGAACVAVSLATIATGVLRIMADRHFTTDVLLGAAIGFGSGYGLPTLLHYRGLGDGGPEVALLPFAGPSVIGLGVGGAL